MILLSSLPLVQTHLQLTSLPVVGAFDEGLEKYMNEQEIRRM